MLLGSLSARQSRRIVQSHKMETIVNGSTSSATTYSRIFLTPTPAIVPFPNIKSKEEACNQVVAPAKNKSEWKFTWKMYNHRELFVYMTKLWRNYLKNKFMLKKISS
ncbi:hypothetical protein RJT34_07635 [Clitoria ternatea]|uniref:Uncharacterized protein n=1 Tax=Clitoria ternatea TaxID=43366 RepID=A0AAN9K5I8_CLITE